MRKIISLTIALLILGVLQAQNYHIINGGFEDWEGSGASREPVRWNSFMTSDGDYSSYVQYQQIFEVTTNLRPGTTGTKCIRTQARVINILTYTITANGQFTTGRVHAGAMNAQDETKNYNYTVTNNSNFNQPMNGKPDSIYFWGKFICTSLTQTARMKAIIHSNNKVQEPEISGENQYVVARATRDFSRGSQSWVQYKTPFVYTANAVTPAFILITFTTNSVAGAGNSSDELFIDDVEVIYNRRLSSLRVNNVQIAGFNGDITNYTYNQNICIDNPSQIPTVTAATASPNATYSITQPTFANPVATVTVTHGGATKTYTINFNIKYKTAQTVQGHGCLGVPYTGYGFNVTSNSLGTQQYTRVISNVAGCDSTITLNLTVHPVGPYFKSDTICQRGGYNNHGFSLSADQTATAGNFIHQLPLLSSFGCDSTIILNLHVKRTSSRTLIDRVCQNTAYNNNGFNIPAEQLQTQGLRQFTNHFTNSVGCDSAVTLNLTVDPVYNTELYDNICLGGDYAKNGFNIPNNNIVGEQVYTLSLTSRRGCDSTVTLHLTTNSLIIKNITDEVCEGMPYANWGFSFSENITASRPNQILRDTAHLSTPRGCDSLVTLAVMVNPKKTTQLLDTICQHNAYNENGFDIAATRTATIGFHYDTLHLPTSKGCDSTVFLTLFIKPIFEITLFDTVCSKSYYNRYGFAMNISGSGNQQFTNVLTAGNGCDSIVTLRLRVNPVYSDTTHFMLCGSGTYRFYDRILDEVGIYDTTFRTINGCDSTKVLILSRGSQFRHDIYAEICEGEVYNQNGFYLSATGIDSTGYIALNGCDSIVILHLTVNPKYQETFTVTACDSYLWEGVTYTESGIYSRNYNTRFGCDSLLTLHLTIIHASPVTLLEDTVRGGFRYEKSGFVIEAPLVSQPILDTLIKTNAVGCDSMAVLHLTVLPTTVTSETRYFCENDGYEYESQPYTTPNIFADTIYSDTETTINIIQYLANSEPLTELYISDCSPYFWDGDTYATTGDYTKTYPLSTGCDSTVILHFTRLMPITPLPIYDTVCQGESFVNQHFNLSADLLPTAGEHHFTSPLTDEQYICPTIAEAFIYVKPTYHFTETVTTACSNEGYTWAQNNQHYTKSGVYFNRLTTAAGCDSIYQLNLTIYPSYLISSQQTLCSNASFVWRGRTIEESDIYYDSLQTTHGCDSIFMLTATVVNSFYSVLDTAICAGSSLQWHGATYSTNGVYYRRYSTAHSCDSVYRLNLTILPIETYEYSQKICEGDIFVWGEQSITASGDYSYIDSTGACPIIRLLHLTVYPKSYTDFEAGAMAGEEVNVEGIIIPSDSTQIAGNFIFQFILTNQYGCDSVISVHLFINNAIAEVDLAHIRLFPNPATDKFTIINEDNSPIENVAVYDIMGRLVEEHTCSAMQISIPVTHWKKGFYMLKIKTTEAVITRKVIIQ